MNETEKLVHSLIDKIQPYLRSHGGGVEVVSIEDGIVYVKMLGACDGCPLIDVTLKQGIEELLLENVPGVIAVIEV